LAGDMAINTSDLQPLPKTKERLKRKVRLFLKGGLKNSKPLNQVGILALIKRLRSTLKID